MAISILRDIRIASRNRSSWLTTRSAPSNASSPACTADRLHVEVIRGLVEHEQRGRLRPAEHTGEPRTQRLPAGERRHPAIGGVGPEPEPGQRPPAIIVGHPHILRLDILRDRSSSINMLTHWSKQANGP
ncbi:MULTISPECIES: hypothetical protein [Sphingomonas]|uniref:hypothetical protein n=1 Tax=Sphingomonas TaxID=13687 RepID=UPI002867E9EC|nr:hypothetical protein [Sphingomonas sp. CGMCC 1.13658]